MQRKNTALKIAAVISSLTLLLGFVCLQATGSLPWPFGTRSSEQVKPPASPTSLRQAAASPTPQSPSAAQPSRKELMSSSKSYNPSTSIDSGGLVIEQDNPTPTTAAPPAISPPPKRLMSSSKSAIVVSPSDAEPLVVEPSLPPDSDPFGEGSSAPSLTPRVQTGLPAPIAPAARTGPPAANAPTQQQPAQQKPAAPRKLILPGSKAPAGLGSHY